MKAAAGDLLSTHADNPRDRELVLIIDEDLDRLQALVTDAVQMLRIDAGDFKIHRDRQALADVVKGTLSKMESRLDGHAIVNRVPGDLVVDADRDLLDLALRQLVDNAVKYSPPTSTIELGASNGSGQVVEISVKNSGPAIPEREQSRIFERFYRGTQARQVAGTGMGLAIVQQIARAHNGSLTVSSSPGAGTEFTIALPKGGAPE